MSQRLGIWCLLTGLLLALSTQAAAPPLRFVDAFGDPLPAGAVARYGTVRLRHGGLQQLAFTQDGKRLLTYGGTQSLEIREWDSATGKLLQRRSLPQREGFESVAFAPDGGIYLIGMGAIYFLKDLKSEKKKVFEQMDLQPTLATVSPNGKYLAVCTTEGGLILDTATGKAWLKMEQAAVPMMDNVIGGGSLAFSPDSKLLAFSSLTGELSLWDVVNRTKVHTYPKAAAMVPGADVGPLSLTFSPDGKRLLAQGMVKPRLLETATPREVAGFVATNDPLLAVRFSADGTQLVAIDQQGQLRRYSATTGKDISTTRLPVANPEGGIYLVAFSVARERVAVVEDAMIHLIDLKTGKSSVPLLADRDLLRTLRWTRDNEIISLTRGQRIRAWDPRTGQPVRTARADEGEVILDVDPAGKHILLQAPEQPPRLRRLSDHKELWKADDLGMMGTAQFSPDGRWVVTTSEAGIDIRDPRTGKVRRSWKLDTSQMPITRGATLSADGRLVALVDAADNRVTIHEFMTGQRRYIIDSPQPADVAFSTRGRHIAVISTDGVVRVFVPGRKQPLFEVVVRGGGAGIVARSVPARGVIVDESGMPGEVGVRCAFSADGQFLVASCANEVRVWDMTGKPVGVFHGHEETILDLAFAPDGKTLATVSADGTGLIWEMSYLARRRSELSERSGAESLWSDLASDDGQRAYRAMTQLCDRPTMAVKLLGAKLVPVRGVDGKLVQKLIGELESDTASVRRQAATSLEAFDVQVETELKRVLEATASAEVRRAIGKLIERLEGPLTDGDRVREVRAVEVLETIGNAEAKTILARLARGADARLTREAKEALARLAAKPQR